MTKNITRQDRGVSKIRNQSELDPARSGPNIETRIQQKINNNKKYNIKYRGWFGERQHQILVLEGNW